jgi:hopanoid C-2 methylase
LRAGKVEQLIHIAMVSHHLIQFTRDCLRGAGESSFYAPVPAASASTAAAV